MNRRGFLKFLGIGAATAAAAPALLETAMVSETPAVLPAALAPEASIMGTYGEYTNFSAFAIAAAIDEVVGSSAKELSYRVGKSIDTMSLTV